MAHQRKNTTHWKKSTNAARKAKAVWKGKGRGRESKGKALLCLAFRGVWFRLIG
jgi:hypothetical protein